MTIRIPLVFLSEAPPQEKQQTKKGAKPKEEVEKEQVEKLQKVVEPIPAREQPALPLGLPPTTQAPITKPEPSPIFGGLAPTEPQKPLAAGITPRPSPTEQPEPGPIFGGAPTGRDRQGRTQRPLTSPFRDKASEAPIQRENIIKKQQEQIKEQAKKLRELQAQQKANLARIDKAEGILSKGANVLSNPAGAVGDQVIQMLQGLGPKGQLAVAAITAIAAAPETIKQIIKILGQKGLPLNRDWEREFGGTAADFFTLEENKLRLIGRDAYVVTEQAQFQPATGSEVYNSLENRDEVIISKLGSYDKSIGVSP